MQLKKILFAIFMGILLSFACSDKNMSSINDDYIDTTDRDPHNDFPENNGSREESDIDDTKIDKKEDDMYPDEDVYETGETRECSNECGFGVEKYEEGEWGECTAPSDGDTEECSKSNDYGICTGFKTCDIEEGWSKCNAPEPEPEIYDGIDNNCSGEIDDGIVNPVTEGEVDEGLESISESDPDNPTGKPGITLSKQSKLLPYLWAANHEYGSVSKFNTETHIEDGRYWVGENPSRTAVDLDGNMWVGGRNDGRLTKVLWDTETCPDLNGDSEIQTSYVDGDGNTVQINSSEDIFADECVVFSEIVNDSYPSIRGVAVGSDGKIWIGYSYGGIQSIDPETFELGPYFSAADIPVWRPDTDDIFKKDSEETVDADGVYGMIVDSNGVLYISSLTNRKYLVAFDTNIEEWIGAFEKDGGCSYGIAVDGKNRIWLGGWPDCSGVVMFDPDEKKAYSFLVPETTTVAHGATDNSLVLPAGQGGGKTGMRTTGVTVEPETGDIWASFFQSGYTGRLILDESDFSNSSWIFIGTMWDRTDPSSHLNGVWSSDLRGVGFDPYGFVWTLGLGSDKVFKIDPATNERADDLPLGKVIGQGSHYTYSDFTGSTAFNFTAPRGEWQNIFEQPKGGCFIPERLDVSAYVPSEAYAGARIRALKDDETPQSEWIPEIDTEEKYFDIPKGIGETHFELTDYKNSLIAPKFEIQVLMTTTNKEKRPILNMVNILWKYDSDACDDQ
ncbi:MAG: hypothetical protein R6W70_02740 [bacterium]